jgi:hypothetical protein
MKTWCRSEFDKMIEQQQDDETSAEFAAAVEK